MHARASLSAVCVPLLWWAMTLGSAHAQNLPAIRAHVNDGAGMLTAAQAQALEQRLSDYEQRTKHQFALLTVPSLEGSDIETFSIRVAEASKLGQKKVDDGLILVLAKAERKSRIEVGYGLEGNIPDVVAARVLREVLTPAFRANDFAGGIDATFDVLMRAADGGQIEQAKPAPASARRPAIREVLGPILLPLIFFFVISMLGAGRRGRGRGFMYGAGMGGFGGGRGGGGGWGGGGGGGGWGGGGGGGFGGGGSSGSW